MLKICSRIFAALDDVHGIENYANYLAVMQNNWESVSFRIRNDMLFNNTVIIVPKRLGNRR